MSPDELRARLTITVDEAADALGIGRTAAYEAVRRGELTSVRLGRRVLIPTAPLLAMLGLGSESAEVERDGDDEPPRTARSEPDSARPGPENRSGARVVELR